MLNGKPTLSVESDFLSVNDNSLMNAVLLELISGRAFNTIILSKNP
jgi:hypothetical protein